LWKGDIKLRVWSWAGRVRQEATKLYLEKVKEVVQKVRQAKVIDEVPG
jgi:hypothetical protein